MISCQWFQRERSNNWKNCTKLPIIKNRGSTLILNKSSRGPPKKHPHQICNKSVNRFKR